MPTYSFECDNCGDIEQLARYYGDKWVQCPECGGALPIKEINVKGIVECVYCNRISKIPKALRY